MQIVTAEEAIAWVDQNIALIQGHAKKYLPFAPYDREDFLQDAYEAALMASKVSAERGISFPACFWITFKGKISDVTPYPDSDRHAGSPSPPSTLCQTSDFYDFDTERSPSSPPFYIDIDRLYQVVRKHLTPVQSRILGMALGIREGRMTVREIAGELECSPANVRQALNRSYERLSRLVENGQLQIDLKDVEVRHLAALFVVSNTSGQMNTLRRAASAA